MNMYTHDGASVGGGFELSEPSYYRPVPVSRPKLVAALYEYAVSPDIPIKFGMRVVNYEESDETGGGTAITDKGYRFEVDIVIAADGIRSKAEKIMTGKHIEAISSDWSIYRVTHPTNILQQISFLAKAYSFQDSDRDYCEVFISPEGQAIVLISRELTTWIFKHVDPEQAEETWSTRLNASDALKSLEDTGLEWDNKALAVISQTPPNTVVDYKVTWRDPNPVWTSRLGRVVKIGDAAHSIIPNSSNGAPQAMEDGQSLAACLRLFDKHNITLATRMHTKLRFEQTSCAQKNGFKNREKWENDIEEARKNPLLPLGQLAVGLVTTIPSNTSMTTGDHA
ncbi:uncharacterized protein A1O9_12748 [Exophiala aquamarina CBS 119918]|uniref:FAD-binding domain-containing protein n=1 Tax=Exophiala aquamarina CBS 119918 TaxID=1182545 RepID=A0A072NTC4_9EURO|nr:uncharacterized protein A1O9_12748 [Exophiala aquamarina CBS 119918]KEF51134.1 hypothetical protein A1O9_12748 [Exophiala aquamarina CBS 119918]